MVKKTLILFFVCSPLILLAIIGYPIQSSTIPPSKNSHIDYVLNSKGCSEMLNLQKVVECYQGAREVQGSDFLTELNSQLYYARKHYNMVFFMVIFVQLILISVLLLS